MFIFSFKSDDVITSTQYLPLLDLYSTSNGFPPDMSFIKANELVLFRIIKLGDPGRLISFMRLSDL